MPLLSHPFCVPECYRCAYHCYVVAGVVKARRHVMVWLAGLSTARQLEWLSAYDNTVNIAEI